MIHNGYLGDLRKVLYTYTAATGRANVGPETMDRLYEDIIDEMVEIVGHYYRGESE